MTLKRGVGWKNYRISPLSESRIFVDIQDMRCVLLSKQISAWFMVVLEETDHVEVISTWVMKINLKPGKDLPEMNDCILRQDSSIF